MKTQKLVLTLFTFVLISWPSYSSARSGCCSSHGGVCGCGCCDGSSLSATCAPYYPSCNETVSAPIKTFIPKNPLLAVNTKLDYSVLKTGDDAFSVMLDWYYPNETDDKEWSVRLSDKASDPGPLTDSNRSKITFNNVKTGNYVMSVKAKSLGEWTDYVYWKDIYVSDAMSKDKAPTSIDYLSQQTVIPTKTEEKSDYSTWAFWATFISIVLGIFLFSTNNEKEKLQREINKLKYPDSFV